MLGNTYYLYNRYYDDIPEPFIEEHKGGSGRTKNSRCQEPEVKAKRNQTNKRAKLARRKNR